MIDDRIAQRRREVRRAQQRRRRRRTLWVAGALLLIIGLVVIERSTLVALDEIKVVGVDRLDADTVREASGLQRGTSTLRLRLRDAEIAVEKMALVEDAQARRVDPLTVEIVVTERRPALVVEGEGQEVIVDREGIVLAEEQRDDLPRIVLAERPPSPGERTSALPALHNAFQVWRGLSGPLRADVVRYHAVDVDDLVLELDQGIDVRFGRAERVDEKVRALGVVLEDVGQVPIRAIDVRAPRAPVVQP